MENEPDMRKLADFIGEALTKTVEPPLYPSLLTSVTNMVDELMKKDYKQLVSLLYEIDVDEEMLERLLREDTKTEPGRIIAALIIERQAAKVKTRQQYKGDMDINEDEKW